jgi:hypothetical protein
MILLLYRKDQSIVPTSFHAGIKNNALNLLCYQFLWQLRVPIVSPD